MKFNVDWSKTYVASGIVQVEAETRDEAENIVAERMGNYSGSMNYVDDEDHVHAYPVDGEPPHPELPRPDSDLTIIRFIRQWSEWFYAHTEVFGCGLSLQLAYLWPAIVKDKYIDAPDSSELVKLLQEHVVPEDNAIWSYIHIEAE